MKHIAMLFQSELIRANQEGRKTRTSRLINNTNTLVDGRRVSAKVWKQYDFDFSEVYIDNGPSIGGNPGPYLKHAYSKMDNAHHRLYPIYNPALWQNEGGLILWARESGWVDNNYIRGLNDPILFWKADYDEYDEVQRAIIKHNCCYFPGIHMHKEFCRLWLRVKEIKIERIQSISPEDCIAEGILFYDEKIINNHRRYKDYLTNANGYGHPDHDYPSFDNPYDSFKSLWININGQESWDENPWVWAPIYERVDMPEDFVNGNGK